MTNKDPTSNLIRQQHITSNAVWGSPRQHLLTGMGDVYAEQLGMQQREMFKTSKTDTPPMPLWMAAGLVGIFGLAALGAGFIALTQSIGSNIPNARGNFTDTVSLTKEDESLFERICTIQDSTRLLSNPEQDRLYSSILIQSSQRIGLLEYNQPSGYSRIVVKADENPFTTFLSGKQNFRRGYVETGNLVNCTNVVNFNPESSYEALYLERPSRSRRNDRATSPKENITAATEETRVGNTQAIFSCVSAQSGVNLRENPMIKQDNIITSIPFNTAVKHSGPVFNVHWQKVEVNGQHGYVHNGNLSPSLNGLCPS